MGIRRQENVSLDKRIIIVKEKTNSLISIKNKISNFDGSITSKQQDKSALTSKKDDVQSDAFHKCANNELTAQMSKQLDYICERLRKMDEDDLVQTEWKTVAETIDRSVFIMFAVVSVFTIFVCALYIPRYEN